MQIAIADRPEMEPSWLNSEEQPVTFQIALVGSDGLVMGSDRLARYEPPVEAGTKALPKILAMSKYFVSHDQSLVCFASGTQTAIEAARRISEDRRALTMNVTEQEWESTLKQVAATAPLPPAHIPIADEILVVRRDVSNAFWFVVRRPNTPVVALKTSSHVCTGASTVAQFLPRNLWNKDRSVRELKQLAILTLSYAADEESSFVGPPFDIMTLDKAGKIEWSEHDPINDKFQPGLERLFGDLSE